MQRSPLSPLFLGAAALVLACLAGCNSAPSRSLSTAERELDAGRYAAAASLAEADLAEGKVKPAERASLQLVAGQAHMALGQFAKAETHLRTASASSDASVRAKAHRGLADIRYRQRDFAGAQSRYQTALSHATSSGEKSEIHYRLAVCARYLCNESGARSHMASAGGYRPAANDPLRYESASCVRGGVASHRPVSPPPSNTGSYTRPTPTPRPTVAPASYRWSGAAPQILPRSSWGARPGRANFAPMGTVTRITVHHSGEGTFTSTSQQEAAKAIKNVQRFHQSTRRWADIGYHYIIDPAGRVWEGRPVAQQGAHAGGKGNKGNVGVMLLGNFNNQDPNSAQLRSLVDMVSWLRQRHGLPATAIYTHDAVRREFTGEGTECPGKTLMPVVARLRTGDGMMVASASGGSYHVRKGDTLFSIARRHGVSTHELQRANPGLTADRLRAGSVIVMP